MRYLMILEVSQKQAYIFASTKLSDNIANSEAICKVTDPKYFEKLAEMGALEFSAESNLVYSGGGHTILEFDDLKKAKKFSFEVSKAVRKEFHEIELFIRVIEYDENKKPADNLWKLSEELEKKKAVRKASFHQGTFGVEKIDATLRTPVTRVKNPVKIDWEAYPKYVPDGFESVKQFDRLGNEKNESSFVAVVHIDGNAMGKRVENLRAANDNLSWEQYKKVLKNFSDSIDRDFKDSYRETADEIAEAIKDGRLDNLNLKGNYFPMRRIILAGDDVCFVTEGRIGIEAARIFLNKLSAPGRKNSQDKRGYTACAGVAIVHQKSPFYKAYEMAEMLCSNAKKYLASFDDKVTGAGGRGCAIDWHIEYGTGEDSLSGIRKMYDTNDKKRLELRPYMISADDELMKCEKYRRYDDFRKRVNALDRMMNRGELSRGKIKELRNALKDGEEKAKLFMTVNRITDVSLIEHEAREINVNKICSGEGLEREVFVSTPDGVRRSLLFDAIEIMDTFIDLGKETEA